MNFPVIACVVVTGCIGIVHGVLTDRWGPSGQLQRSLLTLENIPKSFGDWVSEEIPKEPEDMSRAGIKGFVSRQYRNTRTQEAVSILLACGRGGPISVHTPEICYAGTGYTQIGAEVNQLVGVDPIRNHNFRVHHFRKPDGVSQSQLEIYLAWSRDGTKWENPANVRISLARLPVLYKLYVVREFLPNTRGATSDCCRDFLNRALPEFGSALHP
jgi:Protein of unknown function (DUF3485)